MNRSFKAHLPWIILGVVLLVAGCGEGVMKSTPQEGSSAEPQEQPTFENIRAPSIGPESAPVVIYEISNFT